MGRVVAISSMVALLLLVVVLQMTTPVAIGPLGILMVFILMYVSVLGALAFLLYGGSRIVARISSSVTVKRPIQPMDFGRAYYYSSVISLAPVMFIGMQSVGEVGIYDVLLVILFVVIACFYIAKRGS